MVEGVEDGILVGISVGVVNDGVEVGVEREGDEVGLLEGRRK
jgi:hypothetical protein